MTWSASQIRMLLTPKGTVARARDCIQSQNSRPRSAQPGRRGGIVIDMDAAILLRLVGRSP